MVLERSHRLTAVKDRPCKREAIVPKLRGGGGGGWGMSFKALVERWALEKRKTIIRCEYQSCCLHQISGL
jgi:hypothetical protein